jgi:1,4-alpha-glucan branching enzyme
MAKKHIEIRKQSFSITAPDAANVMLVGEFTHWQENPITLNKGSDGVWRVAVDLPLGTHPYRFIVDGQWWDDPNCSLRSANPFGSENSLRQVT